MKIIFICCLLIFLVKTLNYETDLASADRIDHLGDYEHYIETSRWFIGIEYNETLRSRQYPPLFPIIIIPSIYLPEIPYLIITKNIFAMLTFIPLFLISKKYMNTTGSAILSTGIIVTNIAFSVRFGFKAPNAISALLFCIFIYYMLDSNYFTNRKYFYLASLLFGLLIFTKYIFFLLLPMIIIWLMLDREKELTLRVKSIFIFSILPTVFFLTWSIRNMLLHGFNLVGMLGGYTSFLNNDNHFMYNTIEKISSIFTELAPNLIVTYFLIFTIGVIFIWNKRKRGNQWFLTTYSKRDLKFHVLLLLNFLIFFFIAGMLYSSSILNWRYLSLLSPIYLLLGLIPIFNMIKHKPF